MKLKLLCIVLAFIASSAIAQTNSGSYLDTIYSAENAGVIRVLEGKSNRTATVSASDFKALPSHVQQGSFHTIATPAKKIYDTRTDKQLMDDLHRLLNLSNIKTVSIKNAKKVVKKAGTTGVIFGSSATSIRVKTLPAATSTTNITKQTVMSTLPVKQAVVETPNQKGKDYALIIKKAYGIELDGGFLGEGEASKGYLWTSSQAELLLDFLTTLPMSFISSTKSFRRTVDYMGRSGVLGYVFAGVPTVHICNWGVRPVKFEETLVHEMAHVWMFDPANQAAKDLYIKSFYPGAKRSTIEAPVSSYAYTNVYEDFAEAVRHYWQNGPAMKKNHPLRYEFMRKYVFREAEYTKPTSILSAGSKLTHSTL
jgi:hypothetical protein